MDKSNNVNWLQWNENSHLLVLIIKEIFVSVGNQNLPDGISFILTKPNFQLINKINKDAPVLSDVFVAHTISEKNIYTPACSKVDAWIATDINGNLLKSLR